GHILTSLRLYDYGGRISLQPGQKIFNFRVTIGDGNYSKHHIISLELKDHEKENDSPERENKVLNCQVC
uniref:hypothetical protein n=1 Tax=Paenibacillus illinoisensis TaxID=59845 RepID=UPI001C3FC863